ncbi:TRAP transporter substrate-binding protein [Treponema zioleckii]|uniref:TRAP transporter substrate-binding protein n=1 Tax=Treponema zioleckii TaxID=331680 RepID=UPI00168BBCC8|nr:TRAP transporter substrate-binding protein [Treponema zioleckii]
MKKILCASAALLAAAALLTGCKEKGGNAAAKSNEKSVTLKLSEVHTEGYPTTLADQEFARLVEEKTNGRIKIEVYAGGTLYGDESSAIEALGMGDLAFTRVSASPVAAYVPKINALCLPYLYRDSDHMWNVLNSNIGQSLLADIEASGSGLIGLCYYDGGARSFYLTKEVHSVDDMAGLKIRMQNNPMMVRMCELLGAQGVTGIGPGDVMSAITQGTVDGAENNWPTYQNMGDYQAAKYYILDQHTRVPEILIGSKVGLDKLDPADLAIIKECAKQTQEFEIAKWKEKEESSEKIVRDNGNVIIELDPAVKEEFQTRMAPLYDEFGAEYKDVIEAIKATN